MWRKRRNAFLTEEKSQVLVAENEKEDYSNTDSSRVKAANTTVGIIFFFSDFEVSFFSFDNLNISSVF